MRTSEYHLIEACLTIDLRWGPSVGGFVAKVRLPRCTWVAAGKQSTEIYVV